MEWGLLEAIVLPGEARKITLRSRDVTFCSDGTLLV